MCNTRIICCICMYMHIHVDTNISLLFKWDRSRLENAGDSRIHLTKGGIPQIKVIPRKHCLNGSRRRESWYRQFLVLVLPIRTPRIRTESLILIINIKSRNNSNNDNDNDNIIIIIIIIIRILILFMRCYYYYYY